MCLHRLFIYFFPFKGPLVSSFIKCSVACNVKCVPNDKILNLYSITFSHIYSQKKIPGKHKKVIFDFRSDVVLDFNQSTQSLLVY